MADGLTGVLNSLAALDLAPDADAEFLSNLRAMIATKVRESAAGDLASQADALNPTTPNKPAGGVNMFGDMLSGGGPSMSSSAPGGTMPGGAMPAGPMPGAMGMGAPGPGRGISPRPQPPAPDDLRRLLDLG